MTNLTLSGRTMVTVSNDAVGAIIVIVVEYSLRNGKCSAGKRREKHNVTSWTFYVVFRF